jgi:hypothetical protein
MPVAMEYGSVETGVLAHRAEGDALQCFGGTILSRAGVPQRARRMKSGSPVSTRAAVRSFDHIGDLISDQMPLRSTRRSTVIGRCNDCITLPNGGDVHSRRLPRGKECPLS